MNIIISNKSQIPIYEQISSQIKNLILRGELNEGEILPSMRLLAKELRISVITTKRAYEELERDGFIDSAVGRGSFVAGKNLNIIREQRLKMIEEKLNEAVNEARMCDIGLKQMIEMLELLYGDDENE